VVEARGGAGGVSGGIYNTPYYAGKPNRNYAAANQPNYAGAVYTINR